MQRPVYYVTKSLHEAEVRYLPLEKAILAVVLGMRKLPPSSRLKLYSEVPITWEG